MDLVRQAVQMLEAKAQLITKGKDIKGTIQIKAFQSKDTKGSIQANSMQAMDIQLDNTVLEQVDQMLQLKQAVKQAT